jgi:PAS domain S-box-containing protein
LPEPGIGIIGVVAARPGVVIGREVQVGVPLRVLLIEDSEDDALLLLRVLRRGGYDPVHERVDTAAQMEAALEGREWDLVISDHSMPTFNSSAALAMLRGKGFVDLPFIIVSGKIGEDTAVVSMKAGANDYIMKDNLARLNTAIERELRDAEVRRERRRAERELAVSETRFRLMVEQSPLSVQIFSPDGETLRVNRAWEELWGVTLDQIPGYNVLHDEQLVEKGVMPYIEQAFVGQATAIPPIQYVPDSSIPDVSEVSDRWVRAYVYPVKGEEGEILEVVLMHEDITERMRAEEERRRAEEKYRSIFENAVEGIFQTTVDGRLLTANPAAARMLGYDSPENLLAEIRDVGDQLYVEPERRTEFRRLVGEQGAVSGFEIAMRRKNGGVVWVSVTARVIRDAAGQPTGYEGTMEDVTERKNAERALREIREAERRRISRDLHDGVLQDLTYTLQSMQLARHLAGEGEWSEERDREVDALRRAVEGLRDAIYDLRVEGVWERPLVRSLEALVELNRQMSPEREVELSVEEGYPEEPAGAAGVEVLRVVQESLANVRRHSGARRATVKLGTEDGQVLVEVHDDGWGFEPGVSSGVGITGMKERAHALGGELEVESSPGEGTLVRLQFSANILAGRDPEPA